MLLAVYTLLLVNHILLVYTFHTPVIDPQTLDELRLFLENSRNVDPEYFKIASAQNPKANPEENSGYFQGDIKLSQDQIDNIVNYYSSNRNAVKNRDLLWPNRTVIYELHHHDFDKEQQGAILNAMKDIMDNTCIRFRKRNRHDKHYVGIKGTERGCYSEVGYKFVSLRSHSHASSQELNLADGETRTCLHHATIVHELLHTLGLYHMQSTYDRDNYVRINYKNIEKGHEHNFIKYTSDDVTNLNVPYDYESVMHYGPYAFSANGQKTIYPIPNKHISIGKRSYVKASDWLRVNRLYNCNGAWDETSNDCDTLDGCGNSYDDLIQ